MEEQKEKQMNTDVVDTTEGQAEEEQRVEERTRENTARRTSTDEKLETLFHKGEAQQFQSRWLDIQNKFVDDPRDSVKQADDLVADILKSVTMSFANRRIALEQQWNGGKDVSTEDLRMALKRYRSFFNRLLTLQS
ncbi:MAG TPA: hypothetical protein VK249_20625 [Anaerolineales bacterium]|nr:hypothetical protein [Anaerolineales bacterium]